MNYLSNIARPFQKVPISINRFSATQYISTLGCTYLRKIKGIPCCIISFSYTTNSTSKVLSFLKTMPKEPIAAAKLRHNRVKAKAAALHKTRCPPSVAYLSVLGNGSDGNPRCLYMFSDQTTYIFNCGEGTQRLAHEYKMRLSRLEHLFITTNSWKNYGGLPGLSLTIQDIGVPDVCLHGPPGLENLFEVTKSYMLMKDINIVSKEPKDKYFNDHCMRVDYVPLHSNEARRSRKDDVLDICLSYTKQKELDEATTQPVRKRTKMNEEENSEPDISVAYICKLHNKPGHLVLEKCVEQGVPPGPLLGVLKNGKDVTLPNGRIIKAVDVLLPEEPGPLFIVLECPNESFIDSLVDEKSFKPYQESSDQNKIIDAVFHFSPPNVVGNEKYRQWMNRFSSSTTHILLNSDSPPYSSTAVNRIQFSLNHLDSEIFPLLEGNQNVAEVENSSQSVVVQADTLVRYSLRPEKGVDVKPVVKFTDEVAKEAKDQLNLVAPIIEDMKCKTKALDSSKRSEIFPEVAFLGTGSCIPSKVRNVSGILVTLSTDSTLLLDCGEGTYGQLTRLFSRERAKEILADLKAIFISHLHADHHLGLISILQKREEIFKELNRPCPRLDILAPRHIMWWFINYHKLFEPLFHLMRLVPNHLLYFDPRELPSDDYNALKSNLGLKELLSVDVLHCKNAYGLVFTTNSGFKVVYSGDTMPCDNLVKVGKNCSLLIHEATMEDDLEMEAVIKTHSTTSQAIEIGKRMNADFTLLTHFSQRYAKIPLFNDNFHSNVGIAFDNMKVRPKDLSKLNLLIPPLKELFKEHYEDMQMKTTKKKIQKELLESVAVNK